MEPLAASEKRDILYPNFNRIREYAEEYRSELFSTIRKIFCYKYNITISQYNELREILNISKEKTGHSQWRGIRTKKLSAEQKNLIIASMLGDGGMRKLKYGIVYKEFHSYKQKTYLYSKAEKLKPFIDKIITEGNGFLLQTIPLKELEPLYDEFYPQGKTWKQVPTWVIEKFNIEWLGYWYLDDGSCKENPSISNEFISKEDYTKLQKKLKENDIETTLPEKGKSINIRRKSLKKFYEIIKKYVTPDMLYKIEEKYRPSKKENSLSEEVSLREQWETIYNLGFPYPSLSEKSWDKRFKNLIKNKQAIYQPRENTSLLSNVFYPHMFNQLVLVFKDKDKVIENRLKYADRITPAALLTGLELLSKETRTSFSPLITKMSLDKLSGGKPCNILDTSMGFGERLLGAMASKASHTYFGIDTWKQNHISAQNMIKAISRTIPDAPNRFFTFEQGSENYIPSLKDNIDIAFFSPSFDYENYSWFKNYWSETVSNVKEYLKKDGLFCLNIKKYNLENDIFTIIVNRGFTHKDTLTYALHESIFVFKK